MKIPLKIIVVSICLVLPCHVIAQDTATFVDADRFAVTLMTEELQHDRFIFVDAVVGGKKRRLVFDTGASCNVFNPRLEPDLGEPIGSIGGKVARGAKHTFSRFKPINVEICGLRLDGGQFCVTTSLDHLEQLAGEPIDGVLGIQILNNLKLTLEFSKSRATLGNTSSSIFFYGLQTESLGKDRQGKLFFKQGQAGQFKLVPFLIDTGFSGYISLEGSLFDELVKNGEIQNVLTVPILDGKGKFAGQSGELTTFCVGGYDFERIRVGRSGGNKVGIGLLSMFDLYLDFGSSKIALKPNERFGKPRSKGGAGIGILMVNGKVVVGAVLAGSPAERAAIELGDVIISVDGTDVLDMELFRIRRLMRKKVGEVLDLVLEQGGERVRKSLVAVRRGNTESSLADVQNDPVQSVPK